MSENVSNRIVQINEESISKILGITVEIKLKTIEQVTKGSIFSLIKENNLIICKYSFNFTYLVIGKENTIVTSHFINIEDIETIKISEEKINVKFKNINP